MKSTKSEIKPIKVGKQSGTTYCFGCKDYTKNFRPQEVKMINKLLRQKSHSVFCRSNTKNKLIINVTYKNKMKTYCVKCRNYVENIDPKIEQKIID